MEILEYKAAKVVAEIGCNHMGSTAIARDLILCAREAGADYVKFQKRNNKELLSAEQYNAPHPVPKNSFGETYGGHREFLEFNVDQHYSLLEYCNEIGIGYSSSVWDVTSARELIELGVHFIKVPSACNNNVGLLESLRDNYSGQVQVSVGMTTRVEVEAIVSFFEETNQAKDRLVVYSCTSGYPVSAKDVSLLEINWLKKVFEARVKEIGFSGHHLGTNIDLAAYTLGATWLERHFTKDKAWKGTDHAASLTPDELASLVASLKEVRLALSYKKEEILPVEQAQREKLKWRAS